MSLDDTIVSVAALIGLPVHGSQGDAIAKVKDLVWNMQSTRITYLLVVPYRDKAPQRPKNGPLTVYAIHPSYFYIADTGTHLVFSRKIGNDDPAFFLELPSQYMGGEVRDLRSFIRFVDRRPTVASHRSDYE